MPVIGYFLVLSVYSLPGAQLICRVETGIPPAISMRRWRVFDLAQRTLLSSELPSTGALVEIRVRHERLSITSERHEYLLVVEVENVGNVTLTNYRVDILFPKLFMDIESDGAEVQRAETKAHKLIRRTAANFSTIQTDSSR